jgi:hypothetical protein
MVQPSSAARVTRYMDKRSGARGAWSGHAPFPRRPGTGSVIAATRRRVHGRAMLAAPVDAARRLTPPGRKRLEHHILEEAHSGDEREEARGDRRTLREAIRGSGRTHYELAQASGITPAQLDRFVAGERDLKLATAAKVATPLGLELQPQSD